MIRTYEGATAIVTGGASGIGAALAGELARRGADVVVADVQERLAEEVVAAIVAAGGRATASSLDVRDFDRFRVVADEAVARTGRIDYLFNNAGIAVGGLARHYDVEDWHHVFDVNLGGVAHGVQAAYPHMLRQGFGHLVNTASVAGLLPLPLGVSYTATKHAVVGLSLALACESQAFGVHVTALCPGAIKTPILVNGGVHGRQLSPLSDDQQLALWKSAKLATPDDFAREVLDRLPKRERVLVAPARWQRAWRLQRLLPSLVAKLTDRRVRETLARHPEVLEKRPSRERP